MSDVFTGPRRRTVRSQALGGDSVGDVELGHERISEMTEGMCVLCGSVGQLMYGHIIPAWAHRMMTGRGRGTGGGLQYSYVAGGDAKEYLLCGPCEQRLGTGENYLRQISVGTNEALGQAHLEVADGGLLHGINAALVARAVLGVLFKAHHAGSVLYQSVRLDDRIAVRLTERLLRDDYPPHFYDISVAKLWDIAGSGFPPRDHQAVSVWKSSQTVDFGMVFGGLLISGTLLGQPPRAPIGATPFMALRARRPLNVVVTDVQESPFLQSLLGISGRAPTPPRLIDTSEFDGGGPCPCGGRLTFTDCCRGRWYPSEIRLQEQPGDLGHECQCGPDRKLCL